MIRRPLELLSLVSVGGALGAYFGEGSGWTVLGAVLGASAWVSYDNFRSARLLDWLRSPDSQSPPDLASVWGEAVDRTRKVFKALNRKARKSEARLQAFLAAIQASPNGVILLDKSGAIEWCNLTSAQHFGFDPKRDIGQQIRNLVRNPDFLQYLSSPDHSGSVEIDGYNALPTHPHRISIHLHHYGKGRRMMLSRDVTALVLAEAMRRDFVANVSHEIRTPLTVVSGFIETMQQLELSEEERKRFLDLMAQQSQRMQTLVSDLLTLSRLEGSPAPGISEWIRAGDLLEQVVSEARTLSDVIAKGQHEIVAEHGPEVEIAGAQTELLSALSNLLSNAVRYTPPGGQIKAGWMLLPDGHVEFYVADTGPGIAPEHLPRLTERFYRVDRSRSRETGGTGLGLAIVKHVAQRHGGQVNVESQVGQGSVFRITLPASRVLIN